MNKHLLLLIALLSLFMSCTNELDITDLSQINPEFVVKKTFEYNSSGRIASSDEITVHLYDKNGDAFRLKSGKITVNDKKMDDDNISSTAYTMHKVDLAPASDYLFVITVANDESCTTVVTTPTMAFDSVKCPATISLSDEFEVVWSKDTTSDISYRLAMNTTTGSGGSYSEKEVELVSKENQPDTTGRFFLKKIDTPSNTITDATFELVREGTATYSKALGRKGSVTSQFIFKSSMSVIK